MRMSTRGKLDRTRRVNGAQAARIITEVLPITVLFRTRRHYAEIIDTGTARWPAGTRIFCSRARDDGWPQSTDTIIAAAIIGQVAVHTLTSAREIYDAETISVGRNVIKSTTRPVVRTASSRAAQS